MEEQVRKLVEKSWTKYEQTPKSKRFVIGIAGIPGSGKTSLAQAVTKGINDKYKETYPGVAAGSQHPVASCIPMDGYHLTREQLSAMPDPEHAHARRGAAFTFDDKAFFELIKSVRKPLTPETRTLYAPSFDHAVKDPVKDDISISAQSRVLLFEGNYLALNEELWNKAADYLDELWFIEVDEVVARKRLIARHIRAGIAADEEEAAKRADNNDLINGKEIMSKRLPVTEIVKSKEDDAWKPSE